MNSIDIKHNSQTDNQKLNKPNFRLYFLFFYSVIFNSLAGFSQYYVDVLLKDGYNFQPKREYLELIDKSKSSHLDALRELQIGDNKVALNRDLIGGFENYQNALQILSNHNEVRTPIYAITCRQIAQIYYHNNDFAGALIYYLRWFLIPEKYDYYTYSILNSFALALEKNDYNTYALEIFEIALNMARANNDVLFQGVISGNIGALLLKMKEENLAVKFLNQDIRLSLKAKNYASAANAMIALCEKDKENLQIDEFSNKIDSIEILFRLQNENESKSFYLLRSEFYQKKGELYNAYQDLNSYYELCNIYDSTRNIQLIESVKFRLFSDQLIDDITNKELQIYRQKTLFSLILFVLLFLSIMSVFYWFKETQKRKTKKQLYAYEIRLNDEKIKERKSMIDHYNQELTNIQKELIKNENLLRNNILLNSISSLEKGSVERSNFLNQQLTTHEEWITFKTEFELLYPQFIEALQSKIVKISFADIRLCCLIKLNFEFVEISERLNISLESVRKHAFRLRKKVNLNNNKELKDFISSL